MRQTTTTLANTTTRAASRHAVQLDCELTSMRHGPSMHRLLDLSATGARLETDVPLSLGDRVLVGFVPQGSLPIRTVARVAHVAQEGSRSQVGLAFQPLQAWDRDALERSLRSVPPPLRARKNVEITWAEVQVSWDEDDGDRVLHWKSLETVAFVDDGELLVETRAPMMAVGATRDSLH